MSKYSRSFALAAILILATASNAFAGCREDDLACFRRGFLERGQVIDSMARELDTSKQLLQTKDLQIATQTVIIDAQSGALASAGRAIVANQRAWHEDPKLWFGIGTAAGILTVVLAAVVLHQLAPH